MEEKYYHSKESVEEYVRLAKGVNGQEHINELFKFLNNGSSLLELGSGPGKDWEILSKKYKVTGSDFSLEFIDYLKAKYPKHNFLHLDASKLNTDLVSDGIYSNKVLHHLNESELKQSVEKQASLLNPKGIVYHTFWRGKGDEEFKGMYVKYHEKEDLIKLFERHFNILQIELYKEFEESDSIRIISEKK